MTYDVYTQDFLVEATQAKYQCGLDNLKAELEA